MPAPVPDPRAVPVAEPPLPEPVSAPAPVPIPPPPPVATLLALVPVPSAAWPAASPTAAPVCPIAGDGAALSIFDPGTGLGVRLALGETANCPRASPSGILGACCGKVGVGLSDTRACSSAPRVCAGFSLGGAISFSPAARPLLPDGWEQVAALRVARCAAAALELAPPDEIPEGQACPRPGPTATEDAVSPPSPYWAGARIPAGPSAFPGRAE